MLDFRLCLGLIWKWRFAFGEKQEPGALAVCTDLGQIETYLVELYAENEILKKNNLELHSKLKALSKFCGVQ